MPLLPFHPVIAEWFRNRFGEPTEAQRLGWPHVFASEDTLIAAPTGSGKTLAAFLASIDHLLRLALDNNLSDETRVLYISPLKALSHDVERNLTVPLHEISEAASARAGHRLSPIRAAVRTGDTPSSERQRMVRRPPHIVVTTPESFYLLLTSVKGRALLRTVETVIVDEIHAVARDKRGSHLALSLARLDALCAKRPIRIGLSATQAPIDEIARFLIGAERVEADGRPRCAIVDVGHRRALDVAIDVPPSDLSAVCSNEQWEEVYARIAELIAGHRSTIVFVNTRRLAERVTLRLTERLGTGAVLSHHGSLSKKIRRTTELRLKSGDLKAVVATASLELGIDVGFIDLVVQIGSPRSIAVFLQRVGRSGHALGHIPKGRLFPLTRDELIECAALIRSVRRGELDRVVIPEAPLDILAQQIVAETACEEWSDDALYRRFTSAWPYRNLPRHRFDEVVAMLADGYAARFGRTGAYLHHDRIGKRIKARRGARLTALTSGGAIPELADYRVVAEPEQTVVGSVDEDFAVESLAGDIFLLGNTSWRIQSVRGGDVLVTDAHGAPPTIPFWRGEAPSRTREMSAALSDLRRELASRVVDADAAVRWLTTECLVDEPAARQIVSYVQAELAAVGLVPTRDHLLIERFFDESGGMQLVIHSPFGGRINRAWGLALRKRFCRTFDFELQASADDDGIVLSLGPQQSFPLSDIPTMLPPSQAEPVLTQAVLGSPIFATRWRWNANRSLAVPRQRHGKRVPPPLQRMRADDLLVAVFPQQMACPENLPGGDIPITDHPLVAQTMHDCLHEACDLDGLTDLLRGIEAGRIAITALDTREPSPFAYEILNANPYAFLDDAPLEERRARAVATRRTLTVESVRDLGALDPEAIARVREEAWPLVRDADELYDALMLMGLVSAEEGQAWAPHFDELVRGGRAIEATDAGGRRLWVAIEQWPMVLVSRPDLVGAARWVAPHPGAGTHPGGAPPLHPRGHRHRSGPRPPGGVRPRHGGRPVTPHRNPVDPHRPRPAGHRARRLCPPRALHAEHLRNPSGNPCTSSCLRNPSGNPCTSSGLRNPPGRLCTSSCIRHRVVQPASARAHPPPDAGSPAPRDRTRSRLPLRGLSAPLAADAPFHARARSRRLAGGHHPASGVRDPRRRVGDRRPARPNRVVRSSLAGRTLPDRGGRVGTHRAAGRRAGGRVGGPRPVGDPPRADRAHGTRRSAVASLAIRGKSRPSAALAPRAPRPGRVGRTRRLVLPGPCVDHPFTAGGASRRVARAGGGGVGHPGRVRRRPVADLAGARPPATAPPAARGAAQPGALDDAVVAPLRARGRDRRLGPAAPGSLRHRVPGPAGQRERRAALVSDPASAAADGIPRNNPRRAIRLQRRRRTVREARSGRGSSSPQG